MNEIVEKNGLTDEETVPPRGNVIRKLLTIAVVSLMLLGAVHVLIPTASAAKQNVLIFGLGEPIDSANPYVGITDNAYIYYGALYDYLICPDETLHPTPNLAESWWYMDGPTAELLGQDFSGFVHSDPADWPIGSIWEYNLTQGVFWNDGTPFTADDVVWTINIQIGDNFMAFWAYQPYTRWMDRAVKVNDYKVRIFFADLETKEPFPAAFGYNLFIPMMPSHYFKDKSPTHLAMDWDGIPAIATGPFMGTANLRSEILAKQSVTLVRNPFYNDGLGAAYGREVKVDKLILQFYSESATLELDVKTGAVDTAPIAPQTYLQWLQNPGQIASTVNLVNMLSPTAYSKQTVVNMYPEAPGTLNPLRLDPAVMWAAHLATNKSFIRDQVYKGLAELGHGLISPVWPEWYWDPSTDTSDFTFEITDGTGAVIWNHTRPLASAMDFNLTLANEMLDAAGYEWTGTPGASVRKATPLVAERLKYLLNIEEESILGTGGTNPKTLSFEMVVEQFVFEDRQIADYHVSEWIGIGIAITRSLVNTATWNQLIYSYTYNTMLTYWSGDIDPNYLCFIPTSYALFGWNEFGSDREDYDYLYLQQARSFNYTDRKHWVDETSKWQYLSGGIITTVYPRLCFAYNEARWTNWGNWTETPGMAMNAFWGENPLFWHLEPVEREDVASNMLVIAAIVGVAVVAAVAVASIMKKRKREAEEEEDEEA